ncbi:MAG: LLM class flavin-dependent oxidoreductase [Dehalococcoidia bacterium]|nr:LLM class flavin-dependent oxidoreductase [Dehalococcoidia bacterium]
MAIKLGVSLVCDRVREFGAWVRTAEDAGFDRVGLSDSPSLYPETYVTGTIAALNSTRLKFGPRVTNPVNRHPSVTASAITAIDELSGGRCFLGMGTGDSAVFNIGLAPATVAQMREYILALKAMFAHGRAEYQGRSILFSYAKRQIPIYLAASGPRTLRLAGEICDGVVIGWGLGRELIPLAMRHLREGAEAAGRKVEDIDVWWLIGASIAGNKREAVDAIKTHLAAQPNQAFRLGIQNKGIPADLLPKLQRLIAEYEFSEHVKPGKERKNVRLVEELGLTDYLADRFSVAGTPEEFADRVQELASWGARQLWFTMPLPDKLGFLNTVGARVIPRLR